MTKDWEQLIHSTCILSPWKLMSIVYNGMWRKLTRNMIHLQCTMTLTCFSFIFPIKLKVQSERKSKGPTPWTSFQGHYRVPFFLSQSLWVALLAGTRKYRKQSLLSARLRLRGKVRQQRQRLRVDKTDGSFNQIGTDTHTTQPISTVHVLVSGQVGDNGELSPEANPKTFS